MSDHLTTLNSSLSSETSDWVPPRPLHHSFIWTTIKPTRSCSSIL